MKFLHTADWQIGMKAAHAGRAAQRVRAERMAAAIRVIEIARQEAVDFIVVAGDTFEDNGVERALVQQVGDILSSFGRPVYLIPGNHDPFVPGSVWEHPVWSMAKSVRVLAEEEPVEVCGGLLFPCPILAKYSRKDPTAWIRAEQSRGICLGVAHGTVEGLCQEEPDYPIPLDAPNMRSLDYLALGHWHSTTGYSRPDGSVRMAYSGTHETTKFGERDSGNVLIVEIAAPGVPPVITQARTGGLYWTVLERELLDDGDLERVVDEISEIDTAEHTLIDVRLRGLITPSKRNWLDRIDDLLQARFVCGRLGTSGLRITPQDDSWLADLPVGPVRGAAERLRSIADPAGGEARPAGVTTETASRALLELYSILRSDR
jgi:predicted phosphodiesterase